MPYKVEGKERMNVYKILRIDGRDYAVPVDQLSKLRVGEIPQFEEIYLVRSLNFEHIGLAQITNPSKIKQLTQKWEEADIGELPRLDTREAEREARERGRK